MYIEHKHCIISGHFLKDWTFADFTSWFYKIKMKLSLQPQWGNCWQFEVICLYILYLWKKLLFSCCILRIHGQKLAEMPLVGTRFKYRGQGMFRLLILELEKVTSDFFSFTLCTVNHHKQMTVLVHNFTPVSWFIDAYTAWNWKVGFACNSYNRKGMENFIWIYTTISIGEARTVTLSSVDLQWD